MIQFKLLFMWINIVNALVLMDVNPKVISSINPEFFVQCQHDKSDSKLGPFRIQLQASKNDRDSVVGHQTIDQDANCSSPIRITFDAGLMSTGSFDIEIMTKNVFGDIDNHFKPLLLATSGPITTTNAEGIPQTPTTQSILPTGIPTKKHTESLPNKTALIAGTVVGATVLLVLIALWLYWRWHKLRRRHRMNIGPYQVTPASKIQQRQKGYLLTTPNGRNGDRYRWRLRVASDTGSGQSPALRPNHEFHDSSVVDRDPPPSYYTSPQ